MFPEALPGPVKGCTCKPGPTLTLGNGQTFHLQPSISQTSVSNVGDPGCWVSRRCSGCGARDRIYAWEYPCSCGAEPGTKWCEDRGNRIGHACGHDNKCCLVTSVKMREAKERVDALMKEYEKGDDKEDEEEGGGNESS